MSSASHRAPLSIVFQPIAIRGELSSRRASPANLAFGGIAIPATVPHSGPESFEGLCHAGISLLDVGGRASQGA